MLFRQVLETDNAIMNRPQHTALETKLIPALCRRLKRIGIDSVSSLVLATLFFFTTLGAAAPQQKPKAPPPKRVANPTAGRETFLKHCASCHGTAGKGDGPAAFALKPPPSDLTTLAKLNGGKFPEGYVSAVVKFGRNFAAHGAEDMPVWGSQFKNLDPVHDPTGQQHIDDLVAYLQSLQLK